MLVVKPWTTLQANLFLQVQSVALTVFGCTAGVIMWYTRRYKVMLVGGLVVRLLYVHPFALSLPIDLTKECQSILAAVH